MISPSIAQPSGPAATLAAAVQGAQKARASMQRTAQRLARGEVSERHMVDLMVDHRTYRSNLELIKAADEHLGTVLDVLG